MDDMEVLFGRTPVKESHNITLQVTMSQVLTDHFYRFLTSVSLKERSARVSREWFFQRHSFDMTARLPVLEGEDPGS